MQACVRLGRVLRLAIVVQEKPHKACRNLHQIARRDSRSRNTHLFGVNLSMLATESCEAKNRQRSSKELLREADPEPPED
jgi:hypothetical protein